MPSPIPEFDIKPPANTAVDPPRSAVKLSPESNELPKSKHTREEDDGNLVDSPDAKRRRTDSPARQDVGVVDIPTTANPLSSAPQHAGTQSTANVNLQGGVNSEKGQLETADVNIKHHEPLPGPTQKPQKPPSIIQNTDTDDNVAAVISSIINQTQVGGNVNSHIGDPVKLSLLKANLDVKSQSLPILDNLSTQILCFIARTSFSELTAIDSEPHSENAHSFYTLRSLFDHTKKVYTGDRPFLSAQELGFSDPVQVEVIRKANLAAFVFSLFGNQEMGFTELHDNFLDIFVPSGGRLLKSQAALFLEFKTQTFIAAINNTNRPKSEILFQLFPDDLGIKLLARRPGTRHLAPSETDFVKRVWSRRDILLADINNPDLVNSLSEKYLWQDFLRDICLYISKNIDTITTQQARKPVKTKSTNSPKEEEQDIQSAALESHFPVVPPNPTPDNLIERSMGKIDLVARAARAAQIALQGQGVRRPTTSANQQGQQTKQTQATNPLSIPPQSSPSKPPVPATQHPPQHSPQVAQSASNFGQLSTAPPSQPPQITFHQSQFQFQPYNPQPSAEQAPTRVNAPAASYGYMPGVPHYSQSEPTQILYERARLATTTRSSPTSRRAGLPNQRRPWTTEEENALMAGLDRVKGPHWSQILSMFGPGGTISEALKDRNQVQLKDKARNLKLFFLKSGIEVPYYLKFVSGELKTRAPAQAAKQEARERERRRGEEDKAHVEGIEGMMALAGAHTPVTPAPTDNTGAQGDSHPNTQVNTPVAPPLPDQGAIPQQNQAQVDDQSAEQALYQSLTQERQIPETTQSNTQTGYVDPSLQIPI
ncbi:TTAGGG repeat binding factor [Myotisia sp. PD_48]|nr:TTAGGG repeat binding factor [Myotisia sp. PD_48]